MTNEKQMTPKEKYNTIINCIEEMVQGTPDEKTNFRYYHSDMDICNTAFNNGHVLLDMRGRNTLFQFLTGMTVLEYIDERRMMAAYRHLVNRETWAISEELEIAQVTTQQAFNKKFAKFFPGVRPTEAFKTKDTGRILPARTWEYISNESREYFANMEEEPAKQNTKFGISRDQYLKLQVAQDLQAFYGLSDCESDLAFDLSETNGYDMAATFEYVYKYVRDCITWNENRDSVDQKIGKILGNEYVMYLYFVCHYNFTQIYNVLSRVDCRNVDSGEDIYHCNKMYLLGISVLSAPLEKTHYDRVYNYFMDDTDMAVTGYSFIKYLALVFEGPHSMESALKMIDQHEDGPLSSARTIMWEIRMEQAASPDEDFSIEPIRYDDIPTEPEYDSDGYDVDSGEDDYERESAYALGHEPNDSYWEDYRDDRYEIEHTDEYCDLDDKSDDANFEGIEDSRFESYGAHGLDFLCNSSMDIFTWKQCEELTTPELRQLADASEILRKSGLIAWSVLNCIRHLADAGTTCGRNQLLKVLGEVDMNAVIRWCCWNNNNSIPELGVLASLERDEICATINWLVKHRYVKERAGQYSVTETGLHFEENFAEEQAVSLLKELDLEAGRCEIALERINGHYYVDDDLPY